MGLYINNGDKWVALAAPSSVSKINLLPSVFYVKLISNLTNRTVYVNFCYSTIDVNLYDRIGEFEYDKGLCQPFTDLHLIENTFLTMIPLLSPIAEMSLFTTYDTIQIVDHNDTIYSVHDQISNTFVSVTNRSLQASTTPISNNSTKKKKIQDLYPDPVERLKYLKRTGRWEDYIKELEE